MLFPQVGKQFVNAGLCLNTIFFDESLNAFVVVGADLIHGDIFPKTLSCPTVGVFMVETAFKKSIFRSKLSVTEMVKGFGPTFIIIFLGVCDDAVHVKYHCMYHFCSPVTYSFTYFTISLAAGDSSSIFRQQMPSTRYCSGWMG